MMTEQERINQFVQAMKAAEVRFGVTVTAVVTQEKLGEALLVKPQLTIVAIAGWQPPDDNGDAAE